MTAPLAPKYTKLPYGRIETFDKAGNGFMIEHTEDGVESPPDLRRGHRSGLQPCSDRLLVGHAPHA